MSTKFRRWATLDQNEDTVVMSELNANHLFTGTLVRLTAPQPDDKEALARWSNDAEYLRQLDGSPARPRAASHFDKDEKEKDRTKDWFEYHFRVRTLADDKLIGFVALEIGWNHQNAFLGIGIGEPEYRGKGYGSDALRVAISYAFRELNMYRVGLDVFSYNTRAIRAYEKAGFVREAVQRSAIYRDGQRHDVIFMSVLRPEWEAIKT
jgi:RimJ/RimL family protein N-acetyltransferase